MLVARSSCLLSVVFAFAHVIHSHCESVASTREARRGGLKCSFSP